MTRSVAVFIYCARACMYMVLHNSKEIVLRAAKIKFIIEIKLRVKIKFTWK